MEILTTKLYIHKNSGGIYRVTKAGGKARVKIDDEWHSAVFYEKINQPGLEFCRTEKNFREKFEEYGLIYG